MLFFELVAEAPEDPIFGLNEAFKNDPRPDKLNLSIGVYRDENLQPVIMKAVKEAEQRLLAKEKDKEYLPISGDQREYEGLGKLAFGEEIWKNHHEKIASVQTVGGTGALRLGADLLKLNVSKKVSISDPTWPNHRGVFTRAEFEVSSYPYYNREKRCLDVDKMLDTLKQMPSKTVILFQASCHNPSGMDLTIDVWKEISRITQEKGLIPFFDCAYQGFGQGLEKDLLPLRLFHENKQEFLVAYSCSKNFSLYCERVGALYVMLASKEEKRKVQSILKALIRGNISNPPAHGARIVAEILGDPVLTEIWKEELNRMRERISSVRKSLASSLAHPEIESTRGMFCFLDLTPEQVHHLRDEKAIYITTDARINLSALNEPAIRRLTHALS